MRRVVVTGGSCISSLGFDADSAFEGLKSFKNRVVRMADWDVYKQMNTRLAAPILEPRIRRGACRNTASNGGSVRSESNGRGDHGPGQCLFEADSGTCGLCSCEAIQKRRRRARGAVPEGVLKPEGTMERTIRLCIPILAYKKIFNKYRVRK